MYRHHRTPELLMRHRFTGAVIAVLFSATVARAQPLRPPLAGIARHQAAPLSASEIAPIFALAERPPLARRVPPDTLVQRSRRRAPFIVGGALIGGAALGGAVLYSASRTDDAFFVGPYTAIAAGAGAVLGGLIGWAVAETLPKRVPRADTEKKQSSGWSAR